MPYIMQQGPVKKYCVWDTTRRKTFFRALNRKSIRPQNPCFYETYKTHMSDYIKEILSNTLVVDFGPGVLS